MNILNRKIPTIFGLALLLIGIGFAVFILNSTTSLESQAAPEDEPKNIRISDTGPNSFAVSFSTETEVLSSVKYGTSPTDLSQTSTSGTTPGLSHIIRLENLSPSTQYYFMIISGTHEYSDNGVPFSTTTGPEVTGEKSPAREISGSIQNPDGSPSSNALVYLTANGASVLATTANGDGIFSFDASNLLSSGLDSYFKIEDNTVLNLTANKKDLELTAIFIASSGNPLPATTLGQSYNFTVSNEPEASQSAREIGFPIFRESATEERAISIESPEANEGFTDQRPSFEGTALPNESVEIIIQSSQEIKTSVTASSNGSWEYRPETPLEPGNHTITVKTRDTNGILRTLTRPFTVYAQGSQFTEPSVSPSAPTATPTIVVATKTPTVSPTQVASVSPTLEPTSTIMPTQTPIPSLDPTSTPIPQVDPTGPTNLPLVIVSSVVILISGTFIYLLSRMNSL